jgi:phage terminase small subunit
VEKQANKKLEKTRKKKLTPRREKLVRELADPNVKSVAEAARNAGFAPSSAYTTVYNIINDPFISEAVEKRRKRALAHYKVTPEEVIGSAVFQMRSSMDDLMDEEGYFDLQKARETGAVDLIKEIEFDQKIDLETGEKSIRHKVKFDAPSAARKEVANYIGLEKSPQVPIKSFTDLDLAKELMQRLIEKRGWTEEEAIEGIKERFPELDIKLLFNNAA